MWRVAILEVIGWDGSPCGELQSWRSLAVGSPSRELSSSSIGSSKMMALTSVGFL